MGGGSVLGGPGGFKEADFQRSPNPVRAASPNLPSPPHPHPLPSPPMVALRFPRGPAHRAAAASAEVVFGSGRGLASPGSAV